MLLLLFLLGLTVAAELPPGHPGVKLARGNCPPFWFGFSGRCYKYVSTRLSWANAELNCVSQGANLVSIHSSEENNFVRTLIKNFDPSEGDTWIGLYDALKEGRWMWSDGSAVSFTSWDVRQPDNYHNSEHFGEMNFSLKSKWNDWPGHYTVPSVCKARLNCI